MPNKGRILASAQKRIDAIEKEFGEPFAQVLQGFADLGYGKRATGRALEWNESTFTYFLRRHDFGVRWPSRKEMPIFKQAHDCLGQEWLEKMRRGCREASKIRVVIYGQTMTLPDAAERYGVPYGRLYQRYKAGVRGDVLVDPRSRRGRYWRHMDNSNHPWNNGRKERAA